MDITIADQESDTVTPQDQSKHEETIEYSGDIGHSTDENEEVENAAGIEIATEDENAVATTESSAVEGQRIRRTPRWMDDYVVNSVVANSDVAASFDPQSFDEAVLNNNWKKAMDAEIQELVLLSGPAFQPPLRKYSVSFVSYLYSSILSNKTTVIRFVNTFNMGSISNIQLSSNSSSCYASNSLSSLDLASITTPYLNDVSLAIATKFEPLILDSRSGPTKQQIQI
ncbi:hypothetical protein KIW84_050065 [Lathyrus oleraceus]|uniref:Uncharacterized protein n=1 Tax=Pisum sativum TaxID=3888 RepID=A0A9D5ABK9_PEA|nr:hypothetical protein KIW84_050065 [Pisum sativum]